MHRRTVSISERAAEAIDRIARANGTTVSGVVEAAGLLLAEADSSQAEPLIAHLVGDRRGGRRKGAGRKISGVSDPGMMKRASTS